MKNKKDEVFKPPFIIPTSQYNRGAGCDKLNLLDSFNLLLSTLTSIALIFFVLFNYDTLS